MRKVALLADRSKFEASGIHRSFADLRTHGIEPHAIFLDEITDLAHEFLRLKREGYDRALVCGGDGTLHFAVVALAKLDRADRIPLGVVPLGTANDFAKGLGIDQERLDEVVLSSALSPLRSVDMGWVNGHPFVNVASGGGVAKNTTDLSPRLKTFFGRYAYYLNALLKLGQPPEYHLIVRGSDWKIQEACFAFAVGNNALAGGGFNVAPEARLDDGLLDLLLIPVQSVIGLTALATELLKEEPDLSRHEVIYKQDSSFFIDSAEELQINLDGEPIRGRQFRFSITPRWIDMSMSRSPENLPHPAADSLHLS